MYPVLIFTVSYILTLKSVHVLDKVFKNILNNVIQKQFSWIEVTCAVNECLFYYFV